jgi:F0F1-type ATP synthase alpha subunit
MNKAKFIDLLKKEYSNCEPKTMNHLILVLLEKAYLKKVTNKELKESFCEILNVEQSQTNFNRYMNGNSIDESLTKSIEKTVLNLIFDNSIV